MTPPGSSAAASTTTRPSPSYIASPTTWSNPGGPKREPDCIWYFNSATPPCPSSTSHSRSPSSPTTPSRTTHSSGFPNLFDTIDTSLFRTTSRPKLYKNYLTLLLTRSYGITCARSQHKGGIGSLSHASAETFLLEHPRAEQHQGHVATGLETLDFCKGQTNLGAAFHNVGACNALLPSKQRLRDLFTEQLRRWLKHHLFPNDDRILENFETFFEEQWQQHKEQQRRHPRLTHRLIKHLLSALPDNYIIHNEDHANAHLMIYCPNVYNQAAVNTWMDKKTFLLLDKTPQDIKDDMEKQTPPSVRRHYKKLLDYNKPIPYGYIMMKRKKQWSKGRAIVAYSTFFELQRWRSNRCLKPRGRITSATLRHHSYGKRFMSSSAPTKTNRSENLSSSTTTLWASSTASPKQTLFRACAIS